ncbi:hypothetical protein ACFLXU_07900 [Chloroflexota bacterium]
MITTDNTIITRESLYNVPYIPSVQIELFLSTVDNVIDGFTLSLETFLLVANTALPASNMFLKQSLLVQIKTTKDGFIMRSNYIDEEAFGQTLEDVYLDFLTSIRDRYLSLVRREKSLSSDDRSVLDKLRKLL